MRIKNWARFQHYKHRSPPWIKFHRSLLDDKEWNDLSGDASKLLAYCWLLASESNGDLPSIEKIAWRLRMDVRRVKTLIPQLDHWIEHDASEMLAKHKQNVSTETETETETEISDYPKTDNHSSVEGEVKKANGHAESDESKAFDNWNTVAAQLGLSVAQKLTDERKRKLKGRLNEHGLQGWNQALRNLEQMPFCLGENKSGWKVDFDFMLQSRGFNKVLELAYQRDGGEH